MVEVYRPFRLDILATVLLELPVSVVKRADLTGLQPAGDAVEMEGVLEKRSTVLWRTGGRIAYVTDTPSNSALFTGSRGLVGLTFDALNTLLT